MAMAPGAPGRRMLRSESPPSGGAEVATCAKTVCGSMG